MKELCLVVTVLIAWVPCAHAADYTWDGNGDLNNGGNWSDAANWNAHFQVLDRAKELVDSSLEHAAPVRPEDYYTFAIRYEALEQVSSVLAGLESRNKKRLGHLGPEVYAAAVGESPEEPQPS